MFNTAQSTDIPSLLDKRVQLIATQLAPYLAQSFGYHALLYSEIAKKLCADELCIKQQIVIAKTGYKANIHCLYESLPIAADCIDLAILPGILQASENPHQVLREVERVLIPEGSVILISRNPFSWRGINHKINQKRGLINQYTKDISRGRILDWLRLLGLETETQINISITNDKLQKGNSYWWIKKMAQVFCDYFCSYYIIIARKKVSILTPIRPSWRRNKHLVQPRLAEPSVRIQVENWFEQLK